jgi:ATP synthase protein I
LDSYVQLQRVLLRGTLFAGTFGSLVTFWLGSKEDGFSFMLGASVSVVYVLLLGHGVNRMLENQTDAANSKTNSSTGAVLERARHVTSGPLRILLFIALVLGVAKQRESLHVLPAFLGFLSYKVAVLGQMLGALRASNQDG